MGTGDHIGDASGEIAKLNEHPRCTRRATSTTTLTTLGVLPAQQLPRFNKSGRVSPVL
jgi:hypothetical protein